MNSKHRIVFNRFYDDVPHRRTYDVSDRAGNGETCKFKLTENQYKRGTCRKNHFRSDLRNNSDDEPTYLYLYCF